MNTEDLTPDVLILPDPGEVSRAAAELFHVSARQAMGERGRFTVALSGGSTPRGLYKILANQTPTRIEWSRVHLFWGDERSVGPDHPDSNYRMARETLIDRVPIPPGNVHRILGEMDPGRAAEGYESTIRAQLPDQPWPRFDLILLGLGTDGHTASLFPETPALGERDRAVVANWVGRLGTWRVTLTFPVLNAARELVFLVTGAGKAAVLREVFWGAPQPETLPAQSIDPSAGRLVWIVDEAAASALDL